MKKYLTSFAIIKVAEGDRVVGTYSKVDDDGEYIAQNQRFSKIIVDKEIADAAHTIESFLESQIPD